MSRLDIFSEVGKQHFFYSEDINEIAAIAKNINTIYKFELENIIYFGFFDELTLEILIKIGEKINLVVSSGKDIYRKTIVINKNNCPFEVSLENIFSPSVLVKESNQKPTEKINIKVTFSKIEELKSECILVPMSSLVNICLNLTHNQISSIIYCPLTIDNIEYSFLKHYPFLFSLKDKTNLSKEKNYYIDSRYACNQKIFFLKNDHTYIILPDSNKIVRFNESPIYLKDTIKIKKQARTTLYGIENRIFHRESTFAIKEFKEINKQEEEVSITPIKKNETPSPNRKKSSKIINNNTSNVIIDTLEKNPSNVIIDTLEKNQEEDEIINVFSMGGITDKNKIERLINYAIFNKNYDLFVWACARYIVFHPKQAKLKEQYLSNQHENVFNRKPLNKSFNINIFECNPNIFTRFISKSRTSLVNKDILKFTKDKEGLLSLKFIKDKEVLKSSIPNNKLKEESYPKEIISSIYVGKELGNSDDQITTISNLIKSNVKKLSNISIMINYFADYARYQNGIKTVENNFDIKKSIFMNEIKNNNENVYAQAIMILFNCSIRTGYNFSYNQNYELTIKIEDSVRNVFSDENIRLLSNLINDYITSDCSSWFKINKLVSIENIVNDDTFTSLINNANQFTMIDVMPSIIKKIEEQSFAFKKISIIELVVNKLLDINKRHCAYFFVEYLSKLNELNSFNKNKNLIKFVKDASCFILSDVFNLDIINPSNTVNIFALTLIESLKNNKDTIKMYYSYMLKIERYMTEENRIVFYKKLIENIIPSLISAPTNQDKVNIINCIAECIGGIINCGKSEISISYIKEIFSEYIKPVNGIDNLNYEQKAILLNRISRKSYTSSPEFKSFIIDECISLINNLENNKNTKEKIIAYYSLLETIFSLYVKDISEEESRRDIFFAREEDAYRKRINELEHYVNSDNFKEAEFDEASIQFLL